MGVYKRIKSIVILHFKSVLLLINDSEAFFPSSTLTNRIIHTPDGRELTNQELHNIEYFTIESDNLTSWHITTVQKRTQGVKYPTLKTKKVNDHTVLWFLMAVRDATKLEVIPKTQEYHI